MQPDENGVNGRVSHSIPFKPLINGSTDIPELKVQYFDPATGRLETLVQQTEKTFSLGIYSHIILVLFFTTFIVILAGWLLRYISGRMIYRKQYRQAVVKIKQANTTKEAVIGIRMLSEAEGWPANNLSLSDWLQRWKKQKQSAPELDRTIQTLSQIHYDSKNLLNRQVKLENVTVELASLVATGC